MASEADSSSRGRRSRFQKATPPSPCRRPPPLTALPERVFCVQEAVRDCARSERAPHAAATTASPPTANTAASLACQARARRGVRVAAAAKCRLPHVFFPPPFTGGPVVFLPARTTPSWTMTGRYRSEKGRCISRGVSRRCRRTGVLHVSVHVGL